MKKSIYDIRPWVLTAHCTDDSRGDYTLRLHTQLGQKDQRILLGQEAYEKLVQLLATEPDSIYIPSR